MLKGHHVQRLRWEVASLHIWEKKLKMIFRAMRMNKKTEKESLERKEGKQECLWALQVTNVSRRKQSAVLNNAEK